MKPAAGCSGVASAENQTAPPARRRAARRGTVKQKYLGTGTKVTTSRKPAQRGGSMGLQK